MNKHNHPFQAKLIEILHQCRKTVDKELLENAEEMFVSNPEEFLTLDPPLSAITILVLAASNHDICAAINNIRQTIIIEEELSEEKRLVQGGIVKDKITKIEWTKEKLETFKKALAGKPEGEYFKFEGHPFDKEYGHYLIEYVEDQFSKQEISE